LPLSTEGPGPAERVAPGPRTRVANEA